MDWLEGLLVASLAVLIFALGVALGGSAINDGWIDDCGRLGMHSTRTAIYTCARR